MRKFLEYLIVYSIKSILWLRYRITVTGLDKLTPETLDRKGGILFMPNHPAYFVDPMIAILSIWPTFPVRPMIVEYMYYTPFVHGLMRFLDAVPIPNFVSSSNSLKRKRSDKIFQTLVEGLKDKQNFLIYPAGKVKYTAYESVGGTSAIHRILQEMPEANIVLMRVKGLWGSSFSRAFLGGAPNLGEVVWNGLKVVLKNLIFFTPRRDVIIEFVPAPKNFPRLVSRIELNRYLERWYNQPDGLSEQHGDLPGDSFVLVSYSMWHEEYLPLRDITPIADQEVSLAAIPQGVQSKVIAKVAELKECSPSQIEPKMHLATDLGLDSLDIAELAAFLQEQFDVEEINPYELTTVAKLMAIASNRLAAKWCKRKKKSTSQNGRQLLQNNACSSVKEKQYQKYS